MKEPVLAKILRYLAYVVAIVPLIIFSDYVSPFHFGKVVVFRSILYVMLAVYLLLIWKDRSYLPKMTRVGWAFFMFAGAFTLATLASVIPYMSMWGSLERMGGLFTFWHYFVYFVILTAVFRKESDWLNLFKFVITVGVLSAFYGFLQKTDLEWVVGSGNRARIFGTIGNAALFAGYQIVCAFLALTLLFRKENSVNLKIFYASSAGIMIIAALTTAVRGSVLGIGVGLLVFALLYSAAFKSRTGKKALLGLVAVLVLFVGFALLFKNSDFVQSSGYLKRVTDFSFTSYTVQTRFWAWEAGFKGWKETPKTILVGWGPENFNIPFSKYFNPKFFNGPGSETLFDRAHNMFVEIMVTMGLVGLLTYLYIFGSSFKVLWKRMNDKETRIYGVGLSSLLVAYMIHNAFIFDTSANFIAFFTVLGFISWLSNTNTNDLPAQAGTNSANKKHLAGHKTNPLFLVTATGLFIVAIWGIYFFNVRPSQANYTSTRAIVASWSSDTTGAVEKYKEALAYDVPGKYEIRHRFAQYVLELSNSDKDIQEFDDLVKFAIVEVQKNIDENPVDYLPYLYAARLNVVLGKSDPNSEYNDKSLEFSLKALEISPTFVRTYFEIGQAYLNKKDLDNAAKYFQEAARLNPDVGISNWYWGVVELERGNTDLGLAIIEEMLQKNQYRLSESEAGRLVNVYLKRDDFVKIVEIYEYLIKSQPDNAQFRASLAVAYVRVGQTEKAIEQAREAARIDSKFEPEARGFVESLGRQW